LKRLKILTSGVKGRLPSRPTQWKKDHAGGYAGDHQDTREKLNLSRPVFAHELHVSPRTLEKWEQGLTKPNDQAATLIMMVRKFPDTLQRLKQLAA